MTPPITIFIVDDDEDDREFFIEAVAEINPGIIFREFNNGQDALQAVQSTDTSLPDLIFLDLNMPRLNGLQCLQQFKHNERSSEIPVVIYTTSKQKEDMEETSKSGAMHYIIKPTCPKDLKKEIEQVLTTLLNTVNN